MSVVGEIVSSGLFFWAARRTCNGMVLPCSTKDITRCVTLYEANKLFAAGDWSFHHKYTFEVGQREVAAAAGQRKFFLRLHRMS